jgi:hypothetical protein
VQRTETVKRILYYSAIHPELVTENADLGKVIEWADANPVVWRIVRGVKSKNFGRNGGQYWGADRNDSPESTLNRAATFKAEVERESDNFFGWRARFTIAHYDDKRFKSGFFQQFDGMYNRGCSYLDYTPATLDEVITRFLAWCDVGYKFPTKEVRLDKETIRTF